MSEAVRGVVRMRTIVRVGLFSGLIGAVVLALFAQAIGLSVAAGIVVAGAVAGLGSAKWLEWGWYGRQASASLRAALLACCLACGGALLGLLTTGPHSVAVLALHSHVLSLNLGHVAIRFAALGWAGIDVTIVLLSGIAGVVAGVVFGTTAAASKSAKAVRIVTQARLLAAALSTTDSRPLMASAAGYGSGWLGSAHSTGQVMPAFAGMPSASSLPRISGTLGSPDYAGETDQTAPVLPGAISRTPSDAQRLGGQLNDDIKRAFAAWGEQEDHLQPEHHDVAADTPQPEKPEKPEKRTAAPSAFLNESKVKQRRNRKKQDTRDWLC